MMNMDFCSNCGQKTTEQIPLGDHQLRRVCTSCSSIHYVNPKVIGGARVNLGNLLSANVNESAYISLSDFSGAGVKWTNIYKAYLSNYYEKNSIANQAAADFREGEVSIDIADCYKVLAK